MNTFVLHYLSVWKPLGYVLIFLGMMLEGDAVLFATAFLTRQGFFDLGDTLLLVLSGTILGDIMWYFLGEIINSGDSLWNRWFVKVARPFDNHLLRRPFHTIFLSKFTYGLHHPILVRAGGLGLNFTKFLKSDSVAIILWVAIVGGAGYFSGASFLLAKHYLRFTETALILGLAVFLLIWHYIAKFSKRQL